MPALDGRVDHELAEEARVVGAPRGVTRGARRTLEVEQMNARTTGEVRT